MSKEPNFWLSGSEITLVTPNTSSFAADSNGWAVEGSPVTVSSHGTIAAPARRADSLTFVGIPSSRFVQWFSGTPTLAEFNYRFSGDIQRRERSLGTATIH